MDVFLFRHDIWEKQYNCSWYSVDDIPLEARRALWLGSGFVVMASVCIACYLPCALVMYRHLKQSSCYKMMFFLAWWDIVALVNGGLLVGWISIRGMVFCSSPSFMTINAFGAFGMWMGESVMAILLALNRCMELLAPDLAERLFHGNIAWVWIAIAPTYSLLGAFFSRTFSFSSILFSYFSNVHAGYYHEWWLDETYHNNFHAMHNICVLFILTSIYVIFIVGLLWKSKRATTVAALAQPVVPANDEQAAAAEEAAKQAAATRSAWQRKVFLQVAVIATANALTCAIFVYFQFFAAPPWLVYVASYAWLGAHGLPGIIYLRWNITLRNEVRQMMYGLVGRRRSLTSAVNPLRTRGTTHIKSQQPQSQQQQQQPQKELQQEEPQQL